MSTLTEIIQRLPKEDIVELKSNDDKSSVVLHLHGATILSWTCKGEEVLFLSKKAVFDSKKAIRGGIPIVFPCFGPWQHGPQHGFARIKRWKLAAAPTQILIHQSYHSYVRVMALNSNGDATCSVCLEDDEETRKMWNVKFRLLYNIELLESSLKLTLTVHNTDNKVFDFTTLMHTYFRCSKISQASVSGLKGLRFIDKVRESEEFTENRDDVTVDENYDRVYQQCPSEVTVKQVADGKHSVTLDLNNLPDIVVWNPWIEKAKAMSDFDDEEYQTMLCVEAGSVSEPVSVSAGQNLKFTQCIKFTANL